MIRVIVNADDFGLDENRTRAILQAYREGWISTTTVMANMSWFSRAIEMAKGSRLYDNIGLHLNLTEGRPLTEPIKKSRLFCNEDGTYNAVFHNSKRYRLWLPAFERRAVAEEAAAQFEAYAKSGLTLWHLDSHHHVHTDWSVADIVLPLAKSYGFKTVRLSRNFGSGLSLVKRLYKFWLNRKLRCSLRACVDFFSDFGSFSRELKNLSDGFVFELMTHPLFSRDGKLDCNGELTDFHCSAAPQQLFWTSSSKDHVVLCDYSDSAPCPFA